MAKPPNIQTVHQFKITLQRIKPPIWRRIQEDCGGPRGYKNLLKVLAKPKHPEHAEMMKWTGGPFDPEDFDPQAVAFDNPKDRLASITG